MILLINKLLLKIKRKKKKVFYSNKIKTLVKSSYITNVIYMLIIYQVM